MSSASFGTRSAMRAAGPATRPALALRKIFRCLLGPGFGLFRRRHPADPFIACERCDVLPGGERLWVHEECAFKIRREPMHDTARDGLSAHGFKSYPPPRAAIFAACYTDSAW